MERERISVDKQEPGQGREPEPEQSSSSSKRARVRRPTKARDLPAMDELFANPSALQDYCAQAKHVRVKGSGQGAPPPARQDKYPNLNRGGNTADNRFGAGRRRSEIRTMLEYGLLEEVLPLMATMLAEAKDGALRPSEAIKLCELFAKYALGPAGSEVDEQKAGEKLAQESNTQRVVIDFD